MDLKICDPETGTVCPGLKELEPEGTITLTMTNSPEGGLLLRGSVWVSGQEFGLTQEMSLEADLRFVGHPKELLLRRLAHLARALQEGAGLPPDAPVKLPASVDTEQEDALLDSRFPRRVGEAYRRTRETPPASFIVPIKLSL